MALRSLINRLPVDTFRKQHFSSTSTSRKKMVGSSVALHDFIQIFNNFIPLYMWPQKLSDTDRTQLLKPLQEAGWTLVENRDAIYKEFMFKDFNQVIGTHYNHRFYLVIDFVTGLGLHVESGPSVGEDGSPSRMVQRLQQSANNSFFSWCQRSQSERYQTRKLYRKRSVIGENAVVNLV